MEPLGTTKRAMLLGVAIAAFIVILPILFFYVSGFRFSLNKQTIVETGGLYIHRENIEGITTISGGELETPLTSTTALNQGMVPGLYTATITRENFTTWQKHIPVLPQTVTEVHPMQIPIDPIIEPIPQKVTNDRNILIANPSYTEAMALFNAPLPKKQISEVSESTKLTKTRDKTKIFLSENTLYAEWLGNENTPPHYFCDTPNVCAVVARISQDLPENPSFDFFPDRHDIVLLSKKDGIYVTEIDSYGGRNEEKLVSGSNLSFILKGTILYIRDGSGIKTIDLDW